MEKITNGHQIFVPVTFHFHEIKKYLIKESTTHIKRSIPKLLNRIAKKKKIDGIQTQLHEQYMLSNVSEDTWQFKQNSTKILWYSKGQQLKNSRLSNSVIRFTWAKNRQENYDRNWNSTTTVVSSFFKSKYLCQNFPGFDSLTVTYNSNWRGRFY